MPRIATKFDDHQTLGAFEQTPIVNDSLTSETTTIVASDKESAKSGEVSAIVYKLAENASDPIDAALALFGGSPAELAKFAIGAYNDDIRLRAKSFIVTSIEGPEKMVARVVRRIAKELNLDEANVLAKVKANPAYLDMLLSLAK
jgi:hypothetical protein